MALPREASGDWNSQDLLGAANVLKPQSMVIPVQTTAINGSLMTKKSGADRSKNLAIFECDIFGCTAAFKTKFSLQRHYKKHYSKKDLKCRFCVKSFCLPQYKEEHEYTHTGEKPFSCNMCQMQFRQRGKLSHHRKICPNRPEITQ